MYGRFGIKFPQSRMKGERHRLSSHTGSATEPLVVVYYCKTGPCFALMNPKYFHTTLFFISWMFIAFWNLIGFPFARLHDFDVYVSFTL
jgi:hypothetical protein